MSKIHPFRAMYFNPDFVKDFSMIIAPPEFHAESIDDIFRMKKINEFNICNLVEPLYIGNSTKNNGIDQKRNMGEKTRKFKLDQLKNDLYDDHFREIAKKYAGWLETGKIFRDEKPGFYVYERDFWDAKTQSMKRKKSLLGLLSLEDPETGSIKFAYKPSEEEIDQAYRLMKITFSQFSPVIIGYSDPKNSVETLLKQFNDIKPSVFTYDEEGFFHSIHLIHEEGIIDALQKIFNDFKFGVVEGVHSYIAAYRFMEEMKRLEHFGSGTESVSNVFVNLIALDNDDNTKLKPAVKVLSLEDAQSFKRRDLTKQTILRFSSAATQRLLRRNVQTDSDDKPIETKDFSDIKDENLTKEDETQNVLETDVGANVFSLSFLHSSFEVLGIEYEAEDWNLDIETVKKIQKDLNLDGYTKQAVMFVPSEKKVYYLKITNEESIKSILSSKKYSEAETYDINLFWVNFLNRIFAGFDDEKHSINLWTINQLKALLENVEKAKVNLLESESDESTNTLINKNLRVQPTYLISEEDIKNNFKTSGIFMIFKQPEAKELLSIMFDSKNLSRQMYRLQNVPYIGLVSYRINLTEADNLEDDDEV